MYCKWCGMESKDDQRCEWCGRPFAAATNAQATTTVPSQTTAMPPIYPPPVANSSAGPEATIAMQPGMQTQVVPRMADPRDRAAARAVDYVDDTPALLPFWCRLERYLGIMTMLLAAGMYVAHNFQSIWLVPMLLLLFPAGLFMGTFRVIGYYDDNYADCAILLIVAGIVGPVYATAVYLLVALVRQELNASMIGLMAAYLGILVTVGSAAQGFMDTVASILVIRIALDPISWTVQIVPLAILFGGWMCASFTRPLNE